MLQVMAHIKKNWHHIIPNFDVKRPIEIRLRPLPNRRTLGNHKTKSKDDSGEHYIQLDISKTLRTIMHTLFHELQHAEQVEQGRLKHICDQYTGRWEWIWEERNHGRNCGFGQTLRQLDKYKSQPWERDANEKADKVLEQYEQTIGPL